MEPECSLPCSQDPTTGPYLEPDEFKSTPSHPVSLRSIVILFSHLRSVFQAVFSLQFSRPWVCIFHLSCLLHALPISFSLLWWIKVKVVSVLLSKHLTMKAYRGSGGIAPGILDLVTRWRWVISFTSRLLYPQGKSPWYPLDRRLGAPYRRSGRSGEEKHFQPPPAIEP
jgi:hypothetical protein